MVKNGLPAIHPGEYLAEILDELGMSQAEFARRIGVSAHLVDHHRFRVDEPDEAAWKRP